MTLSMFEASVPVFRRVLENLAAILAKGATHAAERDIEPGVLLQARLFPDMFPLVRQVQIATDLAVRGANRLAGREPGSTPDTETGFDELQDRIAASLEKLAGLPLDDFAGSEKREIRLELRNGPLELNGQDFLQFFVLPNLYFHVTTAYNILRHNGVVLGKADFLGSR